MGTRPCEITPGDAISQVAEELSNSYVTIVTMYFFGNFGRWPFVIDQRSANMCAYCDGEI